jgi:hypothetical protein
MELLVIFLGGLLVIWGFKLISHRPHFETAKTTRGHTIRFLDYAESKKHKRLKVYGRLIFSLGIVFLSAGILIELFAGR